MASLGLAGAQLEGLARLAHAPGVQSLRVTCRGHELQLKPRLVREALTAAPQPKETPRETSGETSRDTAAERARR